MKINLPVTQTEKPYIKGEYLVSKTDLKGIITYANDAFVAMSGYSREELVGKSHNLVRHPDMPPQAFEDLWKTVKSGRPWRGVVKNRCKNGDHYWVDAFAVPVRRNDETIGYMSVRSEPSRQAVAVAEALYRTLNQTKAPLPKGGRFKWLHTIKARLTGVVVLLSLIMLAVGAVGLMGIVQSNEGLRSVYQNRAQPMVELDQVARLSTRNRVILIDAIINPSEQNVAKRLEEFQKNRDTTQQSVDGLEKLVVEEDKPAVATLAADYARLLKEGFDPAATAIRAGDFKEAIRISKEHISPLNKPVSDDLDGLIQHQVKGAKDQYETAQQRYGSTRNLVVMLVVIGLLGAAWLGYLLVRAVLGAINTAIHHFDHIAQGNLTDDIDISGQDETGQLLYGLATMQVHLKTMLDEIIHASRSIEARSQNLQEEMLRVVEHSDTQHDRTQEVAAAMEQASESVSEVAASASRAAEAAVSAQEVVDASNATMQQSVTASEQVVRAVQTSSQAMLELFESIHRIGQITLVIKEVADQTNLLALNAAIEAARAGEQGRGFAVVADEVRKLAERTAANTKDISETVNEIQAGTQRAVASMDDAMAQVSNSTGLMQVTREGLGRITAKSGEVTDMAQQIAAEAQQQSAASHDVARNMETIAELVEENTRAAQSAWRATEDLAHTAEGLKALVGHFELLKK
ncbi:hypothetical protein SCT_2218 [Sulfuricella sp. T08]|uniref:methyl-accepting chemotaxis protein n=1 Tax=Sulfuricella sp. T08 TaxID=1632857 RepID=UPI0006179851|nr:methyl-accepting chemotaxis protein [Sulfuricella sp. T08]GAO36803.1 hypothetical protein SCT_2218 [Sulfuricella sp. T08]